MSSNHLDLRSFRKWLVASCVCVRVWLNFECTFSMHSSPALKCSFPARNAFVSSSITRSSSNKKLVLKPPKKEQTMEKSFCKT